MSLILIALPTALATAGLLLLVAMWARTRALDARAAGEYVDSFYKAAQKLIKDDTVPDGIADFMGFLATKAGRPDLARGFALHLIRGQLSAGTSDNGKGRLDRDLSRMSQAQLDTFADAVSSALISSAASDPLLSPVYRNVMSMFLSTTGRSGDEISVERARTVAVDIIPHRSGNDLVAA